MRTRHSLPGHHPILVSFNIAANPAQPRSAAARLPVTHATRQRSLDLSQKNTTTYETLPLQLTLTGTK